MIDESTFVMILVFLGIAVIVVIVGYMLNKYLTRDNSESKDSLFEGCYDAMMECECCGMINDVDDIPKGVSVKDFVLKEKIKCDECNNILKSDNTIVRVVCTNCGENGKRSIGHDVDIVLFLSDEKCKVCGLKSLVREV